VLSRLLHLLHPLAPFVTEALWHRLFGATGGMLITARWPELPAELVDFEAEAELDWVIRGIGAIRAARTELGVPAAARLELRVRDAAPLTRERLARHTEAFQRLARLDGIDPEATEVPKGSLQVVLDEATFALPVAGIVDLDAERQRLAKEIERAAQEIERLERRLGDAKFVSRAPAEVVEEQRARRAQAEQGRDKLRAALERIA
jgi:valyl-tRNA synthetase